MENPKANDMKVRIDNETARRLEKYCVEHNISRAEAIRQGIHLLLAQEK